MSEPFIAQIQAFGFNFAPRGWALCDGQQLAIAQNTSLFSLLGTAFGGDGRVNFNLPDLRGRSIVHPGSGPGLSPVAWGQRGGAETHTLNTSEMPSHNHLARATTDAAAEQVGAGRVVARTQIYADPANLVDLNTQAITNTGGGQAFGIRNPFLGVFVGIALTGIFPSRN